MSTSSRRCEGDAPRVGVLIRARRHKLGMTLQALGDAAGVSISYLSLIERDQATPSLGTLSQIARHLDVDLDFFISVPSARSALTRADERERFSVSGSSIVYERLAADFAGNVLSSFILTIPPGYQSETASHEGEEFVFILGGSITERLDDEEVILHAGDSMHFRGNRPHSWSNHTRVPARVLWTGTLPIFRSRPGGPRDLEPANGAGRPESGRKPGKMARRSPNTRMPPRRAR